MPLPALLAAGIGLQGLSSIAQGVLGIGQLNDAEELRKTPRPEYEIQQEYFDNQGLAKYMAQFGLTQESKDLYRDQADRGLTYSVDAALRGGGGINAFQDIYDTYLQNNQKISAQDSQLQQTNMRYLIDRNSDLAGQKTQKWAIDEYEPYKDAMQAAAQSSASGTKNLFGAASGAIGALSAAQTAISNDKLLGGNTGSVVSPTNQMVLQAPPVNIPRIDVSVPGQVATQGIVPEDDQISAALRRLRQTQLSSNYNSLVA